jgi:ATP-dependent DNA helicase DinG
MSMAVVPRYWMDVEAVLAAEVPGFKHRPQQAELVGLMWDAFQTRTTAAVEAPTGTGKSWAALMVAEATSERVVISTATRALQAQYRDKDVPTLQKLGLLTRSVVVLEGRQNYICWNRLNREANSSDVNPGARRILKSLQKLGAQPRDTRPGRRDELGVGVPDWLWERVRSDSDACSAMNCDSVNCPYTASRAAARSAGIVIVNHYILLADAAIKNGSGVSWGRRSPNEDERENPAVLGPYRRLIVDEAHALEAAAESFGERRVSVRGIQALSGRVRKLTGSAGAVNQLAEVAAEVADVAKSLPQGCLIEAADQGPLLLQAAEYAKRARAEVREITAGSYDDQVTGEVLASACSSLADRLEAIDLALRTGKDDIGARAPSAYEGAIVSQLVDAGPWLSKYLWDQVPSVLMSGTLAVPGRAGYVTERVGLGATVVAQLPPVFDLRQQRLIFVTPRADSGGGARVGDADISELVDLLEASSGRALVLFPAMVDLRLVHDRLDGVVPYLVLGQGVTPAEDQPRRVKGRKTPDEVPMPNARLAELFHGDTHSVLLATRSFFEGVDFPGDSASVVVIMRFPNLRPDDPLTLARRRVIEGRGGSSWMEYQEPSMQLLFKQAAGRVIRRIDDQGIVAVLDPRSGSKQYARRALLSLVPSDFSDSMDDVRKFLS